MKMEWPACLKLSETLEKRRVFLYTLKDSAMYHFLKDDIS